MARAAVGRGGVDGQGGVISGCLVVGGWVDGEVMVGNCRLVVRGCMDGVGVVREVVWSCRGADMMVRGVVVRGVVVGEVVVRGVVVLGVVVRHRWDCGMIGLVVVRCVVVNIRVVSRECARRVVVIHIGEIAGVTTERGVMLDTILTENRGFRDRGVTVLHVCILRERLTTII